MGLVVGLTACEPLPPASPSVGPSPTVSPSAAGPTAPSEAPSISGALARAVAARLGVTSEAVIATEDGAVVARRVGDVTEVDLVRFTGQTFAAIPLAKVTESFPADAAYASTQAVVCDRSGLQRTTYLFGARNDPRETNLRLQGLTGLGGTISANAWVFALAPDQDLKRPYQVLGNEPLPIAAGDAVVATTECAAS